MSAGHADDKPAPAPAVVADDPRFTIGLFADVIAVLEKHGYVKAPQKSALAGAMVDLLHLVREFEGRT